MSTVAIDRTVLGMGGGTVRVSLRGEGVTLSMAQCLDKARELGELVREGDENRIAKRVRLGSFLIQVRPCFAHGTWRAWLESAGVHYRTACTSVGLAVRLADGRGELSLERLFAALHAHQPAMYPSIEFFDANRVSLAAAERAAGVRADDESGSPVRVKCEQLLTNGTGGFAGAGVAGAEVEDDGLTEREAPEFDVVGRVGDGGGG